MYSWLAASCEVFPGKCPGRQGHYKSLHFLCCMPADKICCAENGLRATGKCVQLRPNPYLWKTGTSGWSREGGRAAGDAARTWLWLLIDEESVLQGCECNPLHVPVPAVDNVHNPMRVSQIAHSSRHRAPVGVQTGQNLGLSRPVEECASRTLISWQLAINATPVWQDARGQIGPHLRFKPSEFVFRRANRAATC